MNNEGRQKRVEKLEQAIAPKHAGVVFVRSETELEEARKKYKGTTTKIIYDNIPKASTMNTFEKRISELERKVKPDEGPMLLFMHDTTFEEAKADYEEKTGQAIADEAFKRKLPELSKIIVELHTNEGTFSNQWIGEYHEKI